MGIFDKSSRAGEEAAASHTAGKLCTAIDSGHRVECHYHGGLRLLEPLCCGVIAPGNIEVLDCYQVSGYSEIDEPTGWKLFRVSEISSLKITEEPFSANRPGYHPDYSSMTAIYCRVSVDSKDEPPPEIATTPPPIPQGPEETPFQKHKNLMRIFRTSHTPPAPPA